MFLVLLLQVQRLLMVVHSRPLEHRLARGGVECEYELHVTVYPTHPMELRNFHSSNQEQSSSSDTR